jgi:hypothetical protein
MDYFKILRTLTIIVISVILIILFSSVISKCSTNKKNKYYKKLYFNEYCIIKYKNDFKLKTKESTDIINSFYICRIKDTNYCCKINKENFSNLYDESKKWDSLEYNTNIGDTLYFKYILKDRFFKIKKK